MFIFNKIKLGPFLPRVMLYELILINEIEQRAKIIFLSVDYHLLYVLNFDSTRFSLSHQVLMTGFIS